MHDDEFVDGHIIGYTVKPATRDKSRRSDDFVDGGINIIDPAARHQVAAVMTLTMECILPNTINPDTKQTRYC